MMMGLFTDCVPPAHPPVAPPDAPPPPPQIEQSNLLLRKHTPLCQNLLMNLRTSFSESVQQKDSSWAELHYLLVDIQQVLMHVWC